MLTSLRELLRSKWFGGIVFGLVILAMALWIDDPASLFGGGFGDRAVRAGERGFTMEEFDIRVEQFLARQREQDGLVSRREAVEAGAIDQLFSAETGRAIELGYAERIGAVTSLEAVSADIRDNEVFADPVTGRFDSETYRRVLRTNQLTPDLYEQDLQDFMTLELMENAVRAAVRPPDAFAELQASYLGEARRVAWFTVDAGSAGELPAPSEEELRAFYEERRDSFTIPERRAIAVMRLSAADFLHRIEIAPEDLRAIYESQKAQRFSGPSTRRFVEVAAASETAARDALGRLAGGTDAEALEAAPGIRAVSSRTAQRSELANAELAEALFDPLARAGIVIGPFQQQDVWIVARLEEVVPGTPVPFEEVSETIREELARAEADNLFRQVEADLFNQIGAGLTLDEIAEEVGAPVISYLPLTREARTADGQRIAGLAAVPDLLQTAFEARPDIVSDPIETDDAAFLVEVRDILPPRTPPFEEIETRVERAYRASRESEQLTSFARELADEISAGTRTLEEVAAALGTQVNRPAQAVSRANFDVGLPQNAIAPAFAAVEGEVLTAPGPAPGEITILQVESIARPETMEVGVLSGLVAAELSQSLETDLLAAMRAAYQDTLEPRVDQGALEVYKRSILDQQ